MKHFQIPVLVAWLLTIGLSRPVPAYALDVGTRAPALEGTDLDGKRVRLADLRGKVVIIDFWASWCAPCREEMPVLEALYRRHRARGLVVIGVNLDRSVDNARRFLERTPVSFPVVNDDDHTIASRYSPPRMPSSYIVDQRGIIKHIHRGFRSGDAAILDREVAALLRAR